MCARSGLGLSQPTPGSPNREEGSLPPLWPLLTPPISGAPTALQVTLTRQVRHPKETPSTVDINLRALGNVYGGTGARYTVTALTLVACAAGVLGYLLTRL